ncbi:MAG: outer membrane lipoprotein-sorting protein [Verrucomicrobia bacterium]|jgi:hypothetical protein|nr:outer membrane lipoprotein-sorting protein [Verrucomicrobiota bacterium]
MRRLRCLILWLVAATGLHGQRLPEDFDPQRAEREGRDLTAGLLSQIPAGNSTNLGTLEIRPPGRQAAVVIPVRFTVQVCGSRWISRYEALGPDSGGGLCTLTILHEPGQPDRYFQGSPDDLDRATPLSRAEVATLKFAGSDFWAGDLGLEFLRWPVQRLLKKELKRGQACHVLESILPEPPTGGYARVVSWLDIDTGGIVLAEAWDADRVRMKEFAPKSFRKMEGQWQLKEMRIDDARTGSRTTVHFDVAASN